MGLNVKPEPINLPHPGTKRRSPTELTLELLRNRGWHCDIVERRNPVVRNRSHDMFGIIDIIALTSDGVLGVQSTGEDFAAHWTKLTVVKALASARWLQVPGNRLMLIGWRKLKADRHRSPRVSMISLPDLIPALRAQKIAPERIACAPGPTIEDLARWS